MKLGSHWERDNERVRAGKKRALTDGHEKKTGCRDAAPAPPPRHVVRRDPLPLLPSWWFLLFLGVVTICSI